MPAAQPDTERLEIRYTNEETYRVDFPYPMSDIFQKWWYYHENQTWSSVTWMGHKLWKYPTDLWIFQEIIFELKPDLILETGTARGGSALFMAHLCEMMGKGRVVTVDIGWPENLPQHERITYIQGTSIDPAILDYVPEFKDEKATILTILDSDHRKHHVLAELQFYAPHSDYIIVEDTNLNGAVRPNFGPGPNEAVEEFLGSKDGAKWQRDTHRERFGLTANPGGFLRPK